MKTALHVAALVFACFFAVPTYGTLIDNHDGTVTQIRNDGSVLMWLQDASTARTRTFGVSGIGSSGEMTWSTANNWIANMNAANYLGYDDWRLPTTVDGPYVWGYDGTTTAGCNITTSEMGYMYYTELGNEGYCDTSGNCPQSEWPGNGNANPGPFTNLIPYYYWSGTATSAGTPWPWAVAWVFDFNGGSQNVLGDEPLPQAWAVRDVPVPPDTDGDGIPDSVDACPAQNAMGFDVDRDGCIDSTGGLRSTIAELAESGLIAKELQTGLSAKIKNAENYICAAVNQLKVLKNEVSGQRGKKISNEAADAIIAYVDSVIVRLLTLLPAGEGC